MPGLLFNSDGGSGALFAFEPPITRGQLCRVVDSLQGTQVDVFIQCVSYGSFVVHGTRVGEVYGLDMADDEFENENFRRWAANVRGLLEAGDDPLAIWAGRARDLGMRFFAGLRMNDIHKDWVERWPSLRTRWERERPHAAIGRDVPPGYRSRNARPGQPSDGFTHAFDFAVDEVREHKLALIGELCAGYDIDGLEMDFLSHPIYFKAGREREGAPLLTDFMRRARALADEAAAGKGPEHPAGRPGPSEGEPRDDPSGPGDRRLTLVARVPPGVEACAAIGIDVATWIEDGLVDAVVPAVRGYLDMSRDIRGLVETAAGGPCEVYGGLSDLYVRHYRGPHPPRASVEMLRAAAQLHWRAGAAGIHLFNYDCHATGIQHHATGEEVGLEQVPLFSPPEFQALTEIGDSGLIEFRDKQYLVAHDMEHRTPDEGGETPLPVALKAAGAAVEIGLRITDDVEGARQRGMQVQVTLRIGLAGFRAGADRLLAALNGVPLETRIAGSQVVCDDPPLREGDNRLRIRLEERDPEADGALRVEGVEVLVSYLGGG